MSDLTDEERHLYKLFDRCNQTELYQIARRANHPVTPNLDRDALIRIIILKEQPPEAAHSIDAWRRAIMLFLIDHRKQLETQINCPARSFQEDACSGCIDMQVIHCLTSNGEENRRLIQQKLVQLRRK